MSTTEQTVVRTLTGYAMSRDYRALAALARKQGIACEVNYGREETPVRDVARTMFRARDGEELFEIGARGTVYVAAIGEDDFVRQCERLDVAFLLTTSDLNDQAERFERGWYLRGDALEKLKQWAEAYPVQVFPEMTREDWKKADEVLAAAGLSLTRISASNMRHVITQTAKIVDEGLEA